MNIQFVKFLAAGGVSALANYSSRFVFNIWVGYELAIVLAYFVGMLVAFCLMRQFVFSGASRSLSQQVFRFCLVNAYSLLQTLFVSVVVAGWLSDEIGRGYAEALGHFLGLSLSAVTSYIGHRFSTFK